MVKRRESSKLEDRFSSGDKVLFVPESKIYDFVYYSQVEGKAVICKEGEGNMQDSYAVNITDLIRIKK